MPFRIVIVSSTEGGSTLTDWNRRSRALSFSMYLRYSLSVVAPTHWSSPRESAGLKMFDASIAPSAAPAPTIVCSSSMKRITLRARLISSITALIRSSNWPRYLVPATMSARSRVITFLSKRISGTLPAAISWARPSTIAVLPTPASPIRTGLFFVRLQRIWITRRISFLRPDDRVHLTLAGELGQVAAKRLKGRRLDLLLLVGRTGRGAGGCPRRPPRRLPRCRRRTGDQAREGSRCGCARCRRQAT